MIPYWYRLLAFCAPPFALLHLWWRGRNDPSYRARKSERFGHAPEGIAQGSIWFHAVSAGETTAIVPVIRKICADATGSTVLVTCTTPTGSAEIGDRLGDAVDHCYVPYDFPNSVTRFLDTTKPRILFLVETELWPVLIHEATSRGIPVYLINARLSEKSAQGYKLIRNLTSHMVESLEGVACQYQATANRFAELGVPNSKLHMIGNIKFDIKFPSVDSSANIELNQSWCDSRRVWIAASTHAGEEDVVIRSHRRLRENFPDLLLILVPRHTHRADEIAGLVHKNELSSAKYSEPIQDADVLLVDQMGVLVDLYGWADVAFIGGSLQGTGGHNPIEAAVHGVPMLMGPDRHNFLEITERFVDAGCLGLVTDVDTLAMQVSGLLDDRISIERQGKAAREVVRSNQGATNKLLALLQAWINTAISPKDC